MATKLKVRSTFDYVQDLIEQFQSELRQCEYQVADFYKLPKIKKEDENRVENSITVTKLDGDEAHRNIVASYSNFFTKPELSSKKLPRYPGILVISKSHEQKLTNYINEINKQKDNFKKLVTEIPSPNARFEVVHEAIPNLITLSFYRKIYFENRTPHSIRFTWMNKHSIKTLTFDEAISLLDNSATYGAQRNIDKEKWLAMVNLEKNNLINSNQKFKIRRPISVSPEINVRFSATDRYHIAAALPFIFFDDLNRTKIGTLANYEKKVDPRKRDSQYVVERLYIESLK